MGMLLNKYTIQEATVLLEPDTGEDWAGLSEPYQSSDKSLSSWIQLDVVARTASILVKTKEEMFVTLNERHLLHLLYIWIKLWTLKQLNLNF